MIWENLNESILFTSLKAKTSDEVMAIIGKALIDEGYVKENYIDALIKREKEYPTGLDINGFGVAIPHTSVEYVKKATVAIAILEEPVKFVQMGTDDEVTNVKVVFMLVVVDPNKHMENLQRVIQIIQDQDILKLLGQSKSKQEIIDVVKKKELSL